MAWSTPLTAVSNAALTAAQWNASVRDNLLETAPAKATTAGRIMVTTGANTITERTLSNHFVGTVETTASTTYVDLTTVGPTVTATSGTRAIASYASEIWSTSLSQAYASAAVSGASTVAAADARAVNNRIAASADAAIGSRMGVTSMFTSLTAGSNVFTVQYRVTAGTGKWSNREMVVIPL